MFGAGFYLIPNKLEHTNSSFYDIRITQQHIVKISYVHKVTETKVSKHICIRVLFHN